MQLNKELSNCKREFEDEKKIIIEDHLAEVLSWNKEMCDMKRKHSELKKKLKLVSIDLEHESEVIKSTDDIHSVCASQVLQYHTVPHN